MGLWARFQKVRAMDDYLGRCPELLLARYGYEEHYSAERVLATLTAKKLNLSYADYACALFCRESDFAQWLAREYRGPGQMPRGLRQRIARNDGIYRVLASRTEPSATQASELYRALRDEVAEHFNGGSHQFLPQRSSTYDDVPPLRNSSVPRSGYHWYGF